MQSDTPGSTPLLQLALKSNLSDANPVQLLGEIVMTIAPYRSSRKTRSAEIREKLGYAVIDTDVHT
jgi:hypothetical protein